MTIPEKRAQKMFDALKRITRYHSPERLRKISEKEYGLTGDEAIEMAYENVLIEAKDVLRGMRRPK